MKNPFWRNGLILKKFNKNMLFSLCQELTEQQKNSF
jgi:hypothetical protein